MSPVLDLIVIDKSGPFVKDVPAIGEHSRRIQLVSENHLLDLLEAGRVDKEKVKHLFSFTIRAIDTKQFSRYLQNEKKKCSSNIVDEFDIVQISFTNQSFNIFNGIQLYERFQFWKLFIPDRSKTLIRNLCAGPSGKTKLCQKMNFFSRQSKLRKKRLSGPVEDAIFKKFQSVPRCLDSITKPISLTKFCRLKIYICLLSFTLSYNLKLRAKS